MRYLFFFLLISVNAFSQNYQYALEEVKKASHQDITAPTIPANFVVRNISSTSATLNWTAADDNVEVVDYRIYNNNILLIPSTEGAVTNYKLTGLNPSTNYNLTLRAVDAAGNESKDSNNQVFTTNDKDPEITRFIIVGASIMYSTFYFTDQMKATVEKAYPTETVSFHNHASPGQTTGSYAKNNIDKTLALYTHDSNTRTYVIVTLGGNDRTNFGPYSDLASSTITNINNNLNYIIDAIEAKGFTPILNDLGFRNYDGTTYNNEEDGVLPYNENIIKPLILDRTPEFAFEDGQSFWQLYPLIYNNYETYLSSDNIHPSAKGYTAIRTAFVNTICKYIFTGIAPTKITKNDLITARPSSNNMYREDDYLNAYYYPSQGSSAAGLQSALETYGAVRLDAGTYGINSQTINMGSNKRLYGVPWATKTPKIRILAGSSGIVIDGINASGSIFLESGTPIKNNTIKNIYHTSLKSTGANIEDNIFINITGQIHWDNSASGYFRNNTIIRQWIHGHSPQNVFIGNSTQPSYGNLQIWLNNLTPSGYGNHYDNVKNVTIIGLDSEGWNLNAMSDKAMTYMRNIGDVRIADFGGGNSYSRAKTPPFDIEANNLHLFHSNLNNNDVNNNSKVRANTNVYMFNGKSRYDLEGNGFNFNLSNATATYNSNPITSTVTDPILLENMKSFILEEKKNPISRPQLATIPNQAGLNWASERKGKTDQAAYIQNLINTNKIAELPEGIYYIGSTIKLKGDNEGIRGAGTGKTTIVGITDDFPLITFSDINTNRRWHISNLTLQGGHTGMRVQTSSDAQMMVTGVSMHDVVFRNQTYGMHLYRFFGFDNNFFENINFVNCDIGLFQDPNPNYPSSGNNSMMYMDKNVFYKMQVINCGIGFKMHAKRANNLNSWVDCVFDGNGIAVDLRGSNYSNFINCDFKNHTGEHVLGRTSPISLYSCNFNNNITTSIFKTTQLNMEGCTLLDDVPLLVKLSGNPIAAYIQNSTVSGDLGYYTDGVISNSIMKNNTKLNKLLVHIVNGSINTILNDNPVPHPQYLVRY